MRTQQSGASAPAIGAVFPCDVAPESLRDYARTVERLGFDELWLIEDCFWAGAIASATVALEATDRLAVGIGIMPAVMRNPATIAMEVSALARFFPGRLLPGLGHGVAEWMRQIGAFPSSQLAALEETTLAVRRLLAGETVSMDGRYVHLDDVRLDLGIPDPPPISLGVRGPRSLELSGRSADGTLLDAPTTPAYVAWAKRRIDLGRERAGRSDAHRVSVFLQLRPAEEASVRRDLASILFHGDGRRAMVAPEGVPEELQRLVETSGSPAELGPRLPAEWVRAFAVIDPASDAREAVRARAEAGADSVVFVPPESIDGDPSRPMAALEAVAIPALA